MMILATSQERIFVPLDGPPGLDLTQYEVSIAVVPDTGEEPELGDYQPATWVDVNGGTGPPRYEPAVLPSSGEFQPGSYMVYARISSPPEDVRLESGRLRVGDIRT